jgi:hypothetical protein
VIVSRALEQFSGSEDEFDQWFKSRLADVTGIDLNNPPAMTLPVQRAERRAGTGR